MRPLRGWIVVLSCAPGVPGCFMGYDSRWGEAKRAQTAEAAHATPAEIAPSSTRGGAPAPRTLRVRFRPNRRYLSQTIDVPKQVRELVDDANRVLSSRVGASLEVASIDPWSFDRDEDVDRSVEALEHEDDGKDVDLVVGMIGALPQLSDSFHQLGAATLLGRYVVVRAAARLGEGQAVDRAFDQLSEDARARLLKARTRHRALAVFLHEVGHALGALHESDPTSLMNPLYDPSRRTFGDAAASLMRVGAREAASADIARGQLAILEHATVSADLVADRDREIVRLRHVVEASGPVSAGASGRLPDAEPIIAGAPRAGSAIPARDQERLDRAWASLRAMDVAGAYDTARPLFMSYPEDLRVQDLRCQLATLRFLGPAKLAEECALFERLTSDAGKVAPAK